MEREIANSLSLEAYGCCCRPKDVDEFMGYAAEENLEATKRSCRNRGAKTCIILERKKIVDLSRAFLDTNGAHQGDKSSCRYSKPQRQYPRKRRCDRCQRKVDGDIKRSECVLTERSCGNV